MSRQIQLEAYLTISNFVVTNQHVKFAFTCLSAEQVLLIQKVSGFEYEIKVNKIIHAQHNL